MVVPLPQAEGCDGQLPILCIEGQHNWSGCDTSLPEDHEYDCQNETQLLILRISNVSESLNGTLYTLVYEEFIPRCSETAVRVISNFQLVVNSGKLFCMLYSAYFAVCCNSYSVLFLVMTVMMLD